jgi:hypothetical protein
MLVGGLFVTESGKLATEERKSRSGIKKKAGGRNHLRSHMRKLLETTVQNRGSCLRETFFSPGGNILT